MRIILVEKAQDNIGYSVEAGLADNVMHFDHHKDEHRHYPSPCNNPAIQPIPIDSVVQVTHMDADTFGGLLRMMGKMELMRGLDLDHMQEIDLNGSSVSSRDNKTNQYMVGLHALCRQLKFPRIQKGQTEIDITGKIFDLMDYSPEFIVALGKDEIEEGEKVYENQQVVGDGKVGLWYVDGTGMDPSRPYEDGYLVSIIYRKNFQSISIYGNPKLKEKYPDLRFSGKEWNNIFFQGHPLACGSPRDGSLYTMDQAIRVYKQIAGYMSVFSL
jgi:hypothetical protein